MIRTARTWLRRPQSLLGICVTMFTLTAVATVFSTRWTGNGKSNGGEPSFQTSETDSGSGPRIGERIAVGGFKTLAGKTLADELNNHPLTIAVFVDPNCSACAASKDQMFAVRDAIANSTIYYCVLMLPNDVPSKEHSEFADLLHLRDRAYFASAREKPNAALAMMVIPSYLLMDANGTILQKWPGTNRNRNVRESMAHQIASDALNQLAMVQSNRHD